MTLGTDQLDAWGRTITECDELYREVQLLVRINPEAYGVTDDVMAVVGVANADGREDGDLLHPIVFARRWAWYLAAENRSIPPITNRWVPLVRYISAHLQYLARDDQEAFSEDLRRVRGHLGALVNEHGISQGEAEDMRKMNARRAREELRERVTQINRPLTRTELAVIWPELDDRHWQHLRDRKKADERDYGRGMYPPSWVADIVASGDSALTLGLWANDEYVDVYNMDGEYRVSFEALEGAMLER